MIDDFCNERNVSILILLFATEGYRVFKSQEVFFRSFMNSCVNNMT